MAWTTPTTRITGELITATIWNTDIVDNLIYLKNEIDTDTHTMWFPVTLNTGNYGLVNGSYVVAAVNGTGGNGWCGWMTPTDWASSVSLQLSFIATFTGTFSYDIYSDYNATGASGSQYSASSLTNTLGVTNNFHYHIDISSIYTSLGAGFYCGFKLVNNSGAGNIVNLLGIRLIYTRT